MSQSVKLGGVEVFVAVAVEGCPSGLWKGGCCPGRRFQDSYRNLRFVADGALDALELLVDAAAF